MPLPSAADKHSHVETHRPTVEKLATDLGAPVRTVVRWRDHLVKEGLVSIKRRRRPLTSMIYLTARWIKRGHIWHFSERGHIWRQ